MAEQDRTEEEAVDRQGDEAEMMARLQEEISNLPVSDHLVYMMHSLSALAVGRLGLAADAAERRDLSQARLAIDAFRALLSVLEPVRPAGVLAVHRGMLSQLQLAYAGAMATGGTADQPDAVADQPEAAAEKPEAPQAGKEAPSESQEVPPAGDAPRKKAAASKKAVAPKKPAPQKTRKPPRSSQTGS